MKPNPTFDHILALERALRRSEAAMNFPLSGTGPQRLGQLRQQVAADRQRLRAAVDELDSEQMLAYGKYRLGHLNQSN